MTVQGVTLTRPQLNRHIRVMMFVIVLTKSQPNRNISTPQMNCYVNILTAKTSLIERKEGREDIFCVCTAHLFADILYHEKFSEFLHSNMRSLIG